MLAKDDFKKAQIKQKNVRHTNLLSRRHFEAVPECCAQSLPVAASVTAPLKIPAQFDKLLLSPSSRGNTALQRRYSMAMSTLLPRYVPGVGALWFTLGSLRYGDYWLRLFSKLRTENNLFML